MKRKDFFKRLGLIAGGVAIAPQLLIPKDKKGYLNNFTENVRETNCSNKFTWAEEIVQRISKIKDILIYPGHNHIVVKVEKPDYYQTMDVVEFIISRKNRVGHVVGKSGDHIAIKAFYNRFPNAINNAEYLRTIGSLQQS